MQFYTFVNKTSGITVIDICTVECSFLVLLTLKHYNPPDQCLYVLNYMSYEKY